MILIKDKGGNMYVLDTDKMGNKHRTYGPQKDVYTIPPLKELPLAPASLKPCFHGDNVEYEGAREYP